MTTVPQTWWSPVHHGGRMEQLDPQECRRLLATTRIGRLGYVSETGPKIVPMNFVVAADNVLLRTAAGNEVARCALNEPVAFQVDQVDEFLQSGWSVLVTGVAEELPAELLRSLDIGRTPDPWPAGLRSLFLQIPIMAVTGRRVHPA